MYGEIIINNILLSISLIYLAHYVFMPYIDDTWNLFCSFVFFGILGGGDSIKKFYLSRKHIADDLDLIEVIKLFMSFIYI